MNREKIFDNLDNLLANKHGKNFINHLVRSYVPITKVEKVFIRPQKVKFKCAITSEQLVSINEILKGIQEDKFKDDLFKYLHTMFNPNSKEDAPIKKLMADRKLGVQGTKTDTFMSIEGYHIFFDWLATKVVKGDKHITWLMRKAKETITDGDGNRVKREVEQKEVRATFSLGDLPALQALKKKLDSK
tara:strand:+ start:185120 stop:185683 length:564 start_codon:yes stop_codon:yes gene_type:complete